MGWRIGPSKCKVDYLVIGSGFGGSVMAAKLAERRKGVCLFERGKAYPPGSFPRTPSAVDNALWDPKWGRQGMFNMWSFAGIDAITASGLGGGSLIYANVMLEKPEDWFTQPIPDGSGNEEWSFGPTDLADHYEALKQVLNVGTLPDELHAYSPKTARLRGLGGTELAPLAVRFSGVNGPAKGVALPLAPYGNIHGEVERTTCTMCGECDVGCNSGAKSSMDHTYLSMAADAGAEICVRTEVREIRRCTDDSGHLFDVVYVIHRDDECPGVERKEPLREHHIKAKRVVLAAGTLGSTLLMLRSKDALGLGETAPIGTRFCGNGDLLGFALPGSDDTTLPPSGGPVITTYRQFNDDDRRILVQDGGLPNLHTWGWSGEDIRKLLGKLIKEWVERTVAEHRPGIAPEVEQHLFDWPGGWPLPLLGMGADIPDGTLTLIEPERVRMACSWRIKRSRPHFDEVRRQMRSVSKHLGASFFVNPQLLLKKVITVHPLGGCPADTSEVEGVVDSYGRVRGVPGLWITDGSVMPGPVGANPSLTIAAFARRAAIELRKEELGKPSTAAPFVPTGRVPSSDKFETTP
jgi:cholesterol oxidase